MKPRNFDKIKALLIRKKAALIKADRDFDKEIREEIENRHGDDVDIAEADYEQELSFQLKTRGQDELRRIDEALARMEQGEYGVCAECGEDIPKKRLEAQPYSILCVECQELLEADRMAKRR